MNIGNYKESFYNYGDCTVKISEKSEGTGKNKISETTGNMEMKDAFIFTPSVTAGEADLFKKPEFTMAEKNETSLQPQTGETSIKTSGYASLPAEDKKRYHETLMNLDKNARLFIMDEESGLLRRCAAMEVKDSFDNGKEVFLATRIREVNSSSLSAGSSSSSSDSCFLIWYKGDYKSQHSSNSESKEYLNYSVSKMNSWDDLDFVDMNAKGVPGLQFLPKSGSNVQVSENWDYSSSTSSGSTKVGLFTTEKRKDGASSHSSQSERPL